jgi:hypothetical protein
LVTTVSNEITMGTFLQFDIINFCDAAGGTYVVDYHFFVCS